MCFVSKQKTAYEIEYGLVGSEMCIRDRCWTRPREGAQVARAAVSYLWNQGENGICCPLGMTCLLYTSDAADERSSVDLGGRRIIKKKKLEHQARDDAICITYYTRHTIHTSTVPRTDRKDSSR